MEIVSNATNKLENGLGKFSFLKKLEEKTGIPKFVLVVASSLVIFVLMYVTVGPGLLCNLVGFVYPSYASFQSIERDDREDDVQWLTYWLIYASFTVIETFSDVIVFWFPFYYSFKFGFLIWLFLPNIRGAEYLYVHIIVPFIAKRGQDKIIKESNESNDANDKGGYKTNTNKLDNNVKGSTEDENKKLR